MLENFDLSLYLVTDSSLAGDKSLEDIVCQAVAGGVTIVQLREKELETGGFIARARRLKAALAPHSVPLIINDRIDVALASDADGVHIGQSDMSYVDARAILGPDKIIGLSVESLDELIAANELDVDYIGISPLHATPTKTDTAPPFGIEGCTEGVDLTRHPSVAIGGINLGNVAETMACGVDGVAVVSAIICAEDPQSAAAQLKKAICESRPKWSQVARRASKELYRRIITQPFNCEMMSGELSNERFVRYIEQDKIYIANYSAEMLQLAAMLPHGTHRDLFEKFSVEGMEAEKALHALLSQSFGRFEVVEPSATTKAYMNHTRQWVDGGDVEFSMAAILPCIWIYSLVGRHIYENCSLEGNPYREWVETYSSEMMQRGVKLSVELADMLAEKSSPSRRVAMRREFVKAVWYEWAFWAYAYSGEDVAREYNI
ncbi:MAG: thiamine phosphate synthase [Rikenellaceae bacterium]